MAYRKHTMTEHDALLAIQETLSGNEWSADTLDEIAEIMRSAGFDIEDID